MVVLEDIVDILFGIWMIVVVASAVVYNIVFATSIAGTIFFGFLLLIVITTLLIFIKDRPPKIQRKFSEYKYGSYHLVLLLLASIGYTTLFSIVLLTSYSSLGNVLGFSEFMFAKIVGLLIFGLGATMSWICTGIAVRDVLHRSNKTMT